MAVTIPNQWSGKFGDTDAEIAANPTAGRMLIAVIASRVVDGSAPLLAIGDVSRNGWTLLADPLQFATSPHTAAQLQVEVWACPAAQYAGWPFQLIYASAMQITASDVGSACVNVAEVAGTTGQLTVDSVTVATASASTTLALTAPAPTGGANVLQVAAAVADVATAGTPSGTGWTALTGVTNTSPVVGLASAWREATTTGTVTFTLGTPQNWAGVVVALKTAGVTPAQPNPAWPPTSLQIGLGYDLSTPLSRVRWTDQTSRYLALEAAERGVQAELGMAQAGQASLAIRNHDGAYSPRTVALAASATAVGTTTTIKVADASATSVHVADFFRLKTAAGALKQLDVFQVTGLASAAGTTTITFTRADGTGAALAATAIGDVYAGIQIDLFIPWRLVKVVAGTPYTVTSGWLKDLPLSFADAHYSTVQAQGADAIETMTAANPSALRGEIMRRSPGWYWPCDDSNGVAYAANASGVSAAPLAQTASKYGTGSMTAGFGVSTQAVGTAPPQNLFGDAGSGWAQSGGIAADLATKGFALVGSDSGFPSIANGVTILGSMLGTDPTPITAATADPTVVIVRNGDPAAAVGQGAVIRVSIDRVNFQAKVTVWDKTTHAATVTSGGTYQIVGSDWRMWALTFNQTSWALYLGTAGLSASGSCNLVANWSILDVGGEADQFFHGRTFSGIHAHIAVYRRRLTAQEILNIATTVAQGLVPTPPSSAELSSARATRKLNTVGYKGTRVINASVIYDSTEDTPSGTAGDLLSTVAGWEDSTAFADAANQMQYRSRVTAYQQKPVAVLGDGIGELPYQPGQTYDYNTTFIYGQTAVDNSNFSAGRLGSSTLVAIDDTSARRYPGRTMALATRLARVSDAWHLGWWLLARYAYPRQRVGTVTVSAAASNDTASASGRWAFVCGVEVGDLVTVNRRPIGQPAISIRCKVLKVAPVFDRRPDPAVAQVTLTLAAAPSVVPIANDATYGVVGSTVLGA